MTDFQPGSPRGRTAERRPAILLTRRVAGQPHTSTCLMAAAKNAPSLASTLSDLRKSGTKLGRLTDEEFVATLKPEGLTTGNITVDAITGIGGIPRGRVTELFGPPSSGKTTTALQCAANLQQQGGRILFLDHERSLDETYCRALGIDPDGTDEEGQPSFLYVQPRSFEHGANTFRNLMSWVDLVITDSVAAMVSEHELASETGKVELGTRGRLMYQYMRQVTGPIVDSGTAMVFLNHEQDVIDTSPMGQRMLASGIKRKTTPGGIGLKFYASLRLSYKQIGNIRGSEYDAITNENVSVVNQTKTQVTAVKNKVGRPFGQGEVRVRFGKGFSNEWSALDILVRHNVIKKDGAYYRFISDVVPNLDGLSHDIKTGEKSGSPWIHGEDSVIRAMEQQPAFRGYAIDRARAILRDGGWDVQASAEEIAAAKADEDGEKAAVEAIESNDHPDLEGVFK